MTTNHHKFATLACSLFAISWAGCSTQGPPVEETTSECEMQPRLAAQSQIEPRPAKVVPLQIFPRKLSQIRAGQPAVGKAQIAYKVGRFDGVEWPGPGAKVPSELNGALKAGRWFSNDEKLFEDVAEANGQTALADQPSTKVNRKTESGADANPGDPDHPKTSYSVLFKGTDAPYVMPGNNEDDMKTAVLAPDGNYYLTDGHHRVLTYSSMKRGGAGGKNNDRFTLYLSLDKGGDYSGLKDANGNGSAMDEFWMAAANRGQVWLKILREDAPGYKYLRGVSGSADKYHVTSVDLNLFKGALPAKMQLREFENDPYRGILYFCREIGWDKPDSKPGKGLPFLEFYWAEEIQEWIAKDLREKGYSDLDLHTKKSPYTLSDIASYRKAVRAISEWMSGLPPTELIGTSGLTASQMGQEKFDEKKFARLIDDSRSDSSDPKFLKPKVSDEPDAEEIGKLPKPGKLAYSWAKRQSARGVFSRLFGRR